MKTIFLSIFLFVSTLCYSQSSDIIYVPDQKAIVSSFNFNYNRVGFYVGGYITSRFPTPYIYTTPASRLNRFGLSLGNGKIAFMGGGYVENFSIDSVELKPDLWVKVYPLRILTNTNEGFDFILAVNYMNNFRYAVGITIPFRGIYSR